MITLLLTDGSNINSAIMAIVEAIGAIAAIIFGLIAQLKSKKSEQEVEVQKQKVRLHADNLIEQKRRNDNLQSKFALLEQKLDNQTEQINKINEQVQYINRKFLIINEGQ